MTHTAANDTLQIQEKFLDFAEYLYILLCHENTIMMNKGSLTIDNIMGYKRALMEKFDAYVDILQESDKNPNSDLVVAIRNIQKAIKLNTSLQKAQSLHNKTLNHALKSKIVDRAKDKLEDNEREVICH